VTARTWAVFRKEVLDTLRDGRSIFAIFVIPFLLYPAVFLLVSWMQMKENEEAKALEVRVGLVGGAALPFLADSLAAIPGVIPVPLEAAPASLDNAGVNAVLVVPPGILESIARGDSARVQLLYKEADNRSSAAAGRVEPILDQVRESLTVSWARSHGAQTDAPPRLVVEMKDVSLKSEMGRYMAALLIPYLLMIGVAAGSMQTAIDATTGEKERSTLETILATSASRAELLIGKCAAVIAAAVTGAVTGITGLWFTFVIVAMAFPTMGSQSFELSIGPDKLIWIFLTLLPAAVFLSAVQVAIGCFARSMREGQTYASYVYMAAIFLGLGSLGQQTPPISRFFIPILNTALLQREILTDSVQMLHAVAAVGVTTAAAAVMLTIAVRLFSNESVLFRT
jgi:sodium transport system permease protein